MDNEISVFLLVFMFLCPDLLFVTMPFGFFICNDSQQGLYDIFIPSSDLLFLYLYVVFLFS